MDLQTTTTEGARSHPPESLKLKGLTVPNVDEEMQH